MAQRADLAIIGDGAQVVVALLRLSGYGTSEVAIVPFESPDDTERTIATLGQVSSST